MTDIEGEKLAREYAKDSCWEPGSSEWTWVGRAYLAGRASRDAEVEKWKEEYFNVSKFATDYENKLDELRTEYNNACEIIGQIAKVSLDGGSLNGKHIVAHIADLKKERDELRYLHHQATALVVPGTTDHSDAYRKLLRDAEMERDELKEQAVGREKTNTILTTELMKLSSENMRLRDKLGEF